MAIKIDYVARETVTNIKRNLTLSLASMVTVAVSLALATSGCATSSPTRRRTRRSPR